MPARTLVLFSILSLVSVSSGIHTSSADTAAAVGRHVTLPAVVGRWDLEVEDPAGVHPSWLEIRSGPDGSLTGRFVGRFGSAQPVHDVQFADGRLRFGIPPLQFEGTLEGESMRGEIASDAGDPVPWSAVRAPSLTRREPPRWDEPYALISPAGLEGWRARGDGDAQCWSVDQGTLSATGPCTDLVTERKFKDFKLDLEFMLQPGSDSGVHLRGRYEIQLKDDAGCMPEALTGLTGGVYGFIAPLRVPSGNPGEWQTLHATLVGRTITVVLNGGTVIDAQEIPGITGDALDSDEALPGPIMLQGYLGAVSYRNIVITPAISKVVQM